MYMRNLSLVNITESSRLTEKKLVVTRGEGQYKGEGREVQAFGCQTGSRMDWPQHGEYRRYFVITETGV